MTERVEYVSPNVAEVFYKRLQSVLSLLKQYEISFEEIGIFGSYARGTYKITSDIDLCVITETRPDRKTSGSLREEAELFRADIIYVTREYFETNSSRFAHNLRRDYRRVSDEERLL
jgi:predicted nucleotidyltransferase